MITTIQDRVRELTPANADDVQPPTPMSGTSTTARYRGRHRRPSRVSRVRPANR